MNCESPEAYLDIIFQLTKSGYTSTGFAFATEQPIYMRQDNIFPNLFFYLCKKKIKGKEGRKKEREKKGKKKEKTKK